MTLCKNVKWRAPLLVGLVFWLYSPAWQGTALWDDANHVPEERPSFYSAEGLRHIWTTPGFTQQYYPLTFTSVWVGHRLWHSRVLGYHLLTIAFHAANALLVAALVMALGLPGAWWAAFLFAVHPVQVESVAWMSEIKNTQSTFFFLLALLALIRNAPVCGFVFFLGALMSKSVTCTLPVVFLIVQWARNGRVTRDDARRMIPFLLVGVAVGVVTGRWERTMIGALGSAWQLSLIQRFFIATHAFWFAIGKLVWPHPLVFVYPRWPLDHLRNPGLLGAVALVGVLVWSWSFRERWTRVPLAAVLLYGVMLSPALGFVNAYPMRYTFVADHYQYAASVAMLIAVAAGLATTRWGRIMLALLIALFSALTWVRAHDYQSAIQLWQDTELKNPTSRMVHENLGFEYLRQGDILHAQAEEAGALKYTDADDLNGFMVLGDFRLRSDHDPASALALFNRAYETAQHLPPSQTADVMALSIALFRSRADEALGRWDDVSSESARALGLIDRLSVRPYYNATPEIMAAMRAEVYARLARRDEDDKDLSAAIDHWRQAVLATPRDSNLVLRWAQALSAAHRDPEAAHAYREVLWLNPNSWIAHDALGLWSEKRHDTDGAVIHDQAALDLNPDLTATRDRLARLLLKGGKKDQALAVYAAGLSKSSTATRDINRRQ